MSRERLSQERIWELLQGQVDVLTPMAKKEEEFFKRLQCVNCNSSSTQVEPNVHHPFSKGSPLPNKVIHCLNCGASFDPYTRVIVSPPTSG
jgi:transcription elongation factor Elf1